jgi:hypothetical protein
MTDALPVLLGGPSQPPALRKGDRAACLSADVVTAG